MSEFSWIITEHACRVCMGRVLMREAVDGRRLYKCACCGVEGEGSHASICTCGMTWRSGKAAINAGVRCVRNERRSPENMAEIVAVSVEPPKPGN